MTTDNEKMSHVSPHPIDPSKDGSQEQMYEIVRFGHFQIHTKVQEKFTVIFFKNYLNEIVDGKVQNKIRSSKLVYIIINISP